MLILLDIDGVMVPASSWKKPDFLNDGFSVFSGKAMISLNKIIEETNANILLTTSHKTKYSIIEWKNIFKSRNVFIEKIYRLDENILNFNRKDEILEWHKNFSSIENFVILDDDKSLNGLPENLKDKLVLTSPLVGLTNELAIEAILILKQELILA